MNVTVGDVVLPGDYVGEISTECDKSHCILGPGLRLHSDKVIVCKSGILKKKSPNTYYVDCSHQKRYVPARRESVVGVVTNKGGDIFKVDIGSSEQASLSYLAFEGATKKNRPDVQVGDVIFSKLVMASRDMEPEVVCVDHYGKKGKLGELPEGGFIFTCSLNLIRKILHKKCPLLKLLGKEIPHEIVIGMNGKVWVKAPTTEKTIAVCNAILAAEHITNEEIVYMCDDLVNVLAKME
ncbi:exosome complex component RRP40 [Anabrus simplex]|uniref:exosome complex component RRP40 n=1 Tax=Anabrus simplex TaxID=316456 RepID=UPI0034DDB1DC